MRILVLFDVLTLPRQADIDVALNQIRTDYIPATDVTWTYEARDFSNLTWVDYQANAKGVSWNTVTSDTREIFLRDGERWDNIIYLIDPANWKAPGIGGWNLGSPINGYCVELVIASLNPTWLYKIFAMEIAHSWNDTCIQETGDNLLDTFGVQDFDNQVIHGVDTRYGVNVPPNAPMTGYYTNYDYRPMIEMAKLNLAAAYNKRAARYGIHSYYFVRDLFEGRSGDDVVELQKRFTREGLASYVPTGFFGPKTKASAIAFQKKYGIYPQRGFVGPLTRAKLNVGATQPPRPTGAPAEIEALLISELF